MEDDDYFLEPATTLTEPRELLMGYLDGYRAAVLKKFDGMAEADVRRSVLPSGWTALELLKHLAYVERRWFRWGFVAEADETVQPVWADWDEATQRWAVTPEESVADIRALFLDECARSREIAARGALDDQAATGGRFNPPDPHPSLIWILFHVLQEYARHLGHLDVVRELADGSTGQ